MILTLTPNPALDVSGKIDKMIPDEKNYVHDELRSPGGNGVNVARLLKRLKVPVVATGFLGQSVGGELSKLLDNEKVKHNFVQIKGHTRISVTVSHLNTHKQTRLSFQGPRVSEKEVQQLIKKINSPKKLDLLVIGGSFPPGFNAIHANLAIEVALKRASEVVVDIPGELLLRMPLDGVLLIKPNLIEFQALVKKEVKSISSVARLAKQLAHKMGLVCVSSVEGGAVLASRDFVWFGKPPQMVVNSTVGAGDSMVAAMTAELWRRKTQLKDCNDDLLLPDLLRQGLAAAAATLATGGTQLGDAETIKKLTKKIMLKKF